MGRPRLYRDPVHLQIRHERAVGAMPEPGRKRLGWLIQKLIDLTEFQRLRHIRQTGLTNLVFHGAEHSRFSHSMGVAWLAGQMFTRICRNMDEAIDEGDHLATCTAALLHDVGHGPFSHTLEEILEKAGVRFKHERMSHRIILESDVCEVLNQVDAGFATQVAEYIHKKRVNDHWKYKVVSSQLDADRLDYLLRDAAAAGIRGTTVDLPRLLDMLHHLDGKRIAVHRKGLETVEGYLVALDHMYRSVYYHHAVRAASTLLGSILQRALQVAGDDPARIFGHEHPLLDLVQNGDQCQLASYLRLGEFHIWTLIDAWCHAEDRVLADLSRRLMSRKLFKTLSLDPGELDRVVKLLEKAKQMARDRFPHLDEETVELYVSLDQPSRTSYRRYDWSASEPDESIWILDDAGGKPIQDYDGSRLIDGLKKTRFFPQLIFPEEIREQLQDAAENA